MADRAAKLRRLDAFRRSVPHLTASALAKVLDACVEGIPELGCDRNAVRMARDLLVNETTPYGALIDTIPMDMTDGSVANLTIVNPFAQLWLAANRCEGFSVMLQDRMRARAATHADPWRLVIYSDEVVPGNQLSVHNLRKLWAIYWSLLEFGVPTLSNEDAWFCTAAERSDHVKQVNGGMAQVFGALLKYFFAGTAGHTFQTSGILLNFYDGAQATTNLNTVFVLHVFIPLYVNVFSLCDNSQTNYVVCAHTTTFETIHTANTCVYADIDVHICMC